MPLGIAPEDRKLMAISGAVLVLVVAAALLLAPPGEDLSKVPSSYSSGSGGAKAAFLLLSETGYQVERWEQPPADLPLGPGVTLILASPGELLNAEGRLHLQRFVAAGGRVIAAGAVAATFLPENGARSNPLAALGWATFRPHIPGATARVAPEITMAPEAFWSVESAAAPLYGEDDKIVAVRYRSGHGEIVWWAAPTPLTNAGLKETHNLEFFLSCIGNRENNRVLWDEYFHGHRRSLAATLGQHQIGWIFGQSGFVALLVLWSYSRRRGPVRPLATETRLSPLEFVETLGKLYGRASANSVAVEVWHQRFRYWLTRRLGVSSDLSLVELESLVRSRWRFSDPSFAAVLARCEAARFDHNLPQKEALRLVQALHGFAERLRLFPASPQEKR
jgi:hypothetical protein